MKTWLRRLPLLILLLGLAGWVAWSFRPIPILVDTVPAEQGSFQLSVNEDGKTRIREKYLVSSPVSGKLLRIELDEGDVVKAGETVLARIEPGDPSLLDARAQAEAEARVRAAEASVQQSSVAVERAKRAYELAESNFGRVARLRERGSTSQSEYEEAEHRLQITQADLRSAEFGVAVANFELEQAKAALVRTKPATTIGDFPETLTIVAPVNGQVLRVLQKDAGVVASGATLLELGDAHDLEMVIDVLSSDAVSIRPGCKIFVEHWGGQGELIGTVRLVEPSAFLKVSALGVEEQRVNVIADFTSSFEHRPTLGDGYRVEARIIIEEVSDVIMVPSGTLFREQGAWHVFRVQDGSAVLAPVEPGRSNGLETEIVSGLSAGDLLILHPSDDIQDGTLVRTN